MPRLLWFVLLGAVISAQLPLPDVREAWMCPMHPDVTSEIPGKCVRCGMNLVLGTPFDTREYRLEVNTIPAAPQAAQPFKVILAVFHPGTGDRVMKFETVHEKRFHLFVVRRDLEFFQHVHPEQSEDGTW